MRSVLLGLMLLWVLAGCSTTGAKQGDKAPPQQAAKLVPQQAEKAVPAEKAAQPVEKLGVGDAVKVTVFQQPDLTLDTRVDEKGTILMPLVGSIKVAGLTTNAAAVQIADALKRGQYLNNPQVNVALTTVRSRQVSVLGMVAKPGRYPLDETSSQLADVIAAAGGILPTGSETILVTRDGSEQKVPLIGKGYMLKGGETVYVDRAPMFYIYGEVTRAGAYKVEPNMSVMQAIAAGGGMTPRGSDRRLKLRRTTADGKWVETDVGLQEAVRADDVIYVREALF
ncbi:MAG TPA: polysaccharide biosynthesis/export family protein [Burkholderiales bacterium]|jgi:polysaccharide export outer membrane protein|nr:polysaccharide biosynthesis/export family protein [Burkholderiales bacterium]